MTSYTAIPNSDIDAGSPVTESLMTLLRDNAIAITEGASGAPRIVQAAINAAAVGQAELKTTTGEVSHNATPGINITQAGGGYGFYPRIKGADASSSKELTVRISGEDNSVTPTSYINNIFLAIQATVQTVTAEQRYIQASPPYNLGDGDIALFIFVHLDNGGNVISVYEAPEAPWHYNGPTNIRADRYGEDGTAYKFIKDIAEIDASMIAAGHPKDMTLQTSKELSMDAYIDYLSAFEAADNIEIEITQAIKNADMPLIPRPMIPSPGNTVVMLDTMSSLTAKLAEMKKHDEFSLIELLHDGDLIVSNKVLSLAGPPGVDIVEYRFR